MKICVCVKPVIDTAVVPGIMSGNSELSIDNEKYIINPFDEYAIEEAMKYKDTYPDTEITSVSMGNESGKKAVYSALAMGIDKAIYIKNNEINKWYLDSYLISKTIADNIKQKSFDIIFMGKESVDTQNGAVGIMVAGFLDIPVVTNVRKITYSDKKLIVIRESNGNYSEEFIMQTPCLITVTKGINTPRYPSISGIIGANKKPFEEVELSMTGTRYTIDKYAYPEKNKSCIMIDGDTPLEIVEKIYHVMKNEIKTGL